jgi:hypothetical protein
MNSIGVPLIMCIHNEICNVVSLDVFTAVNLKIRGF